MNLGLSTKLILILFFIFLLPSQLSAASKKGFDIDVLPLRQKIIADGRKVYPLTFVIIDRYRRLLDNQELQLITDTGKLSPVIEDPPGFYATFFTPPEILETKLITIAAQARVKGIIVSKTFKMRIYPYQGLATPVISNPDEVVTGKVRKVNLNVTVQDKIGKLVEDARLTVESTLGEIAEIRNLGGGKYRTTYVLPPGRYPRTAIITIKAESRGMATIDMFLIPLVAKARIEGRTKPRSRVTMKSGKKELGIAESGETGEFELPLTIPPGYNYATLSVTDAYGNVSRKSMDFKIPKFKLMRMYITPERLLADGNSRAEIRIFLIDRYGMPQSKARIVVVASIGEVSPVREEEPGIYVADYITPAGLPGDESQRTVKVRAYIPGGGKELVESGEIKLWAGFIPIVMNLQVQPKILISDGRSLANVRVELKDQAGNLLSGRPVRIVTDLGELSNMEDLGGGVYTAILTSPKKRKKESITVKALLKIKVGRGSKDYFFLEESERISLLTGRPALIAVEATSPFLQADGISSSKIVTKIADANENPIAGESLLVNASRGMVKELKDHGDGSYSFDYVSSKERYEKIARISVTNKRKEFSKGLSITLMPKPTNYSVGLKTGYINNFGRISTVYPGIEMTYRIPVFNRMFFSSLESGWYYNSNRYKDQNNDIEVLIDCEIQVIPISLNVFYKVITANPHITPYFGGGLGANITNSKISAAYPQPTFIQKKTLFGIHGFAGIESKLGWGSMLLEVKYSYAKLEPEKEFGIKGNVGGLVAFLGYRLGF
ncbi:MAG: hypothetical protein JSU92_12540 [Deltaproteobacteria bacterium]|nr:MAG: hypothetical protein JSU92_12540 [Deltaproteobacteria bacterium]